jgi:2-polyprenyl-3-methyl-5-hydroxy-6-metoxy-1,4-benzoquinol methylase
VDNPARVSLFFALVPPPAHQDGLAEPHRLERVACAVCGGERARPVLERNGMAVVRCEGCGLGFVNPRPDAETLAGLYATERYYRNDNASAFGYPDYLAEREQLERFFHLRLNAIEALEPRKGRLLDVGCAIGILVDLARRRGWDAQGVDISPYAVGECRARGLPVHRGDLFSARLPSETFDVAVLDDTIEHVPDPRALIAELRRVLVPGGLLTMNTPNEAGLVRRVQGTSWFHYKPPEHLYYFSPRTLSALLVASGFRVLTTRVSGKAVTLRYLAERLAALGFRPARLAAGVVRRLPGADRPFLLPVGQFVIFARRT